MQPLRNSNLRQIGLGLLLGAGGWLAVVGVDTAAMSTPTSPVANFSSLVAQAFAGNPRKVTDREAAAIMDARLWFSSAAVPPLAAGMFGLFVGVFTRPSLRAQLVAGIVFAATNIDLACCTVAVSGAVGAIGFALSLVGGLHLSASARERLSAWRGRRLGA